MNHQPAHTKYIMKLSLILAATLLAVSWSSARAADAYTIDPMHSHVGFAINHLVINKVRGNFKEFAGTLSIEDKSILDAKGTIQAKSIDTGIAKRDEHLRSPDFFDVAKYPTITFQSKRVEKKGNQMVLVGDYTMHGVTKELALNLTLNGPIKDPMGSTRVGLEAKGKLNRKDYGLAYNKVLETGGVMIGEEVELEIDAEAIKAK